MTHDTFIDDMSYPYLCVTRVGTRWRNGFSPELPRATGPRPNPGDFLIFFIFFQKLDLQRRTSTNKSTCNVYKKSTGDENVADR